MIHCTRDPLDTGLSVFFHYFTGTHFYATDLANIGHQIRLHDRIMAHWREVLPVPVHEASYEKIVADPEPEIRALIDFLGLDWDDRCLAFHETERAVQSASLAQVRQKLYDSAVGRWKPYENHLAPLRQALGL